MKAKEIKIKNFDLKNILSDIINDHKAYEGWKVHSGNKVID